MEAGRELDHRALDAEIAEKVMGFTYDIVKSDDRVTWVEERMYGSTGYGGLWVCKKSDGPTMYGNYLPHYSTDWSAMGLVVEKMGKHPDVRFRTLRLVAYSYNRTYATFDSRGGSFEDDGAWHEANGEHATPHAVALAALAVGTPATTTPTEG